MKLYFNNHTQKDLWTSVRLSPVINKKEESEEQIKLVIRDDMSVQSSIIGQMLVHMYIWWQKFLNLCKFGSWMYNFLTIETDFLVHSKTNEVRPNEISEFNMRE